MISVFYHEWLRIKKGTKALGETFVPIKGDVKLEATSEERLHSYKTVHPLTIRDERKHHVKGLLIYCKVLIEVIYSLAFACKT